MPYTLFCIWRELFDSTSYISIERPATLYLQPEDANKVGFLSSLLWTLVVDSLLVRLSDAWVHCAGLCWHLAIMVGGRESMTHHAHATWPWRGLDSVSALTLANKYSALYRKAQAKPTDFRAYRLLILSKKLSIWVLFLTRNLQSWSKHIRRMLHLTVSALHVGCQLFNKTGDLSPS